MNKSDDLISRAATIDAIVSLAAFQDAEYIKSLCQNPANSEDWLGGVCDSINAVEGVNIVDAVPVRHGRWLDICKADGSLRECSVCHGWQVHNEEYIPKYCPDCGAKMDGDGDPNGWGVAAQEPPSESGREMPKCEVKNNG